MESSAFTLFTTVLTYTLLLLTLLWCWFQWTHRDLIRAAKKLKYYFPALPFIGHSYFSFFGKEEMARCVLEMSKRTVAEGTKTSVFWCGPLPILAVHNIEDIQAILNSSHTLDKGDEYEFFKIGLDSGVGEFKYNLLSAPGSVWKITRKHMNPLFHPRNVQHMMPVFNQNSRALVSCLSEHVGTGPVNVMNYTMDISLKTICDLLFGPGINVDIKSKEFRGLMTVVETIPDIFIRRVLRPWLRIDPLFRFIYKKELKKLNSYWKNFVEKPLEVAKKNSERKNMKGNLIKSTGANGAVSASIDFENLEEPLNIVDAFSILQQSYPDFTEADMRCEIITFFCTGTDTVGSGVASCLLALAQYPEIQERLYQEISSTVGPDDNVTQDDLIKMPYLDQVLKETLRWFILVPYVLRRAGKDINLSNCTIPEGNTIIVSLAGIHLDPKIYPDPFKFDPDRFSAENSVEKERFAFIPFSGGPRNCIAKIYAMQLMKIMLIHVVRKFKLTTEMDIFKLKKRLIVTLVSSEGYKVHLQHRN